VLNRLLNVLIENGKTKKTNLAGKTKLNYLVCMKYIGFLRAAAWIRLTKDPDGEHVSITQKGREFKTFLSNYLEGNELEPDALDDLEDSMVVNDTPGTTISDQDYLILGHTA